MKDTPIQVQARQLASPKIIFGKQVKETPHPKFGWNFNDKTLYHEVTLNNWALVYPNMSRISDEDPRHETNILLDLLKNVSGNFGMKVDKPAFVPITTSAADYEREIQQPFLSDLVCIHTRIEKLTWVSITL